MTTYVASPPAKLQFFVPGTTTPLSGGLLFTYANETTTKQTTYSSASTGTPNTNPIILDANGECVCMLDATLLYTFTLSPSNDTDPPTNPYWTVDGIGWNTLTASFAPLASPAFTGTPTAPTPAAGNNSTDIATTAFVDNALTTYAPLASPAFTGTPTAPTPASTDNSTTLATTAFVKSAIGTNATAFTMQVFSASGSFTVPAGITQVRARSWGGGGGGGGSSGSNTAGSGGGGGGYAEGWLTVTPAQVLTITIGTGGTGGSGSGNGVAGGNTTIAGTGVNVITNGGGGGIGSSSYGASPGGAGGTASGGTLNLSGGAGGSGFTTGGGEGYPGIGGGTFSTPSSFVAGITPGGGGVAGSNGGSGSNGASGSVILEWL